MTIDGGPELLLPLAEQPLKVAMAEEVLEEEEGVVLEPVRTGDVRRLHIAPSVA